MRRRVRLAVVSDTHLAARAVEYRANWQIVERWIEQESPDMVVHLGDISADGARRSDDLSISAGLLGQIEQPLCVLAGNHDLGDNPKADGTAGEEPISAASLDLYRKWFGPDYWSISLPGWQIIGLNAQLCGSGLAAEAEQWRWLEEVLGQGDERVGVMLHKPLFRDGPADRDHHHRYVPLAERRRLEGLLARRKVGFVLSGHTHQTRRHKVGDVDHIWAPSTAFVIPDTLQEPIGDKLVGVMLLELRPGAHSARVAVPDGLRQYNVLDQPHVYSEVAAMRRKLLQQDDL